MEVYDAIRIRRSVRKYSSRDVEENKLIKVLEAARMAPSASNRQEWRLVVVRDAALRADLCNAAKKQAFVREAPIIIACCAETDGHLMSCGQASYPIDVAIAIDHMTLQAVEEGLGTCWVGAFFADRVKDILRIPAEIEVVELLALGYPEEALVPDPKSRLALNEIIRWEKWS